jgi:hypothetical protein
MKANQPSQTKNKPQSQFTKALVYSFKIKNVSKRGNIIITMLGTYI